MHHMSIAFLITKTYSLLSEDTTMMNESQSTKFDYKLLRDASRKFMCTVRTHAA